jgi:hypothetical protein
MNLNQLTNPLKTDNKVIKMLTSTVKIPRTSFRKDISIQSTIQKAIKLSDKRKRLSLLKILIAKRPSRKRLKPQKSQRRNLMLKVRKKIKRVARAIRKLPKRKTMVMG